jgi:amino acid adenylation domain-containing protein
MFEGPSVTHEDQVRQRLAELSPEKRALLQRKLVAKRAAAVPQGVQRRTSTGPCPLSFGQELMWLLDQLTPGVSSYNVPRILRVEGALDRSTLERALNEVLRRHEILHTVYTSQEGQPVQTVTPFVPVPLHVIDLGELEPARREEEALRIAIEWSDRAFDLTRDLLLRMALVRLTATEHLLILVSHHIASDGWSKGLLFRELETLYGAFRDGKPSPLPEPALQYADFAVWQRNYLRGERLEELLGYWKQHLAGAPPLLELSTDYPRPTVQSGRGKRLLGATFPKALADGLKEVGRREGATLFMVGLAAFQVLLYRYTGQEDIVVGTPISGRSRTEVEDILGYFSNSLALRTDLAGDPTFLQLLQRVRSVTLDAYSHQELPFEKLIVELNPERTLSYNPIYQAMFSVVTAQMEELKLPGLVVTTLFTDRGTSKFDITLGMRDVGEGLLSGIEYSTDLFEHARMERMLVHYRTLLEAIVTNPGERISRLNFLTEAERRQLLADGSGPTRAFPLDRCLHQQFEAQVRRTPDAVAVQAGVRRLTYRQLNEQANWIAHLLRQAGVGRGDFVAILQERGVDFLVAMLGTFKAGAAYVPIEPNYPRDRIQYLLTRSEARTLLTHYSVLGKYPYLLTGCHHLRTLVCFDGRPPAFAGTGLNGNLRTHDRTALQGYPATDLDNVNEPTDPLYMIFTSGSTGLPKGVVIRHDAALNHIYAQFDALGLGGDFAFLQSAPSSSDISVWQFLAPVLTGGRTVIIDEASLLAPERLFGIIKGERVTIVELVPVVMQLLTEHAAGLLADQRRLPDLRWMMVTGEAVSVDLVNAWLKVYPSIPVVNAYGPTEAADDVLQAVIDRPLLAGQRSVPIGKPLANINVYIVDDHLQLVPAGVVGEVCIGGVAVAVGYWKDEEKTRASFVPDPFATRPGGRIYRTGDLGRWLPDGSVEFIGRRDGQVKVRGYRVELGEIEAVLRQHPAVREAVVLVTEQHSGARSGEPRELVAYLVADRDRGGPGELRDFVRDKLPVYMVPRAFVYLERLPLTPSGKVDRRALPLADLSAPDLEQGYQAPRTPFEQALADIWMEVLGVERVGINDNFFDLGGHSLLATQVISRVRGTLGVELGLRNLFETPTVAELALALVQELTAGGAQVDDR